MIAMLHDPCVLIHDGAKMPLAPSFRLTDATVADALDGMETKDMQTLLRAVDGIYKIPQYRSAFHVVASSVFHGESKALKRNRS